MNHQNKHKFIIQILTAFLFLNLNIYLPNSGLIPLPGYFIDLLIFFIVVIYYIKYKIDFPIESPLFIWLFYFLSMNIIYFIASPVGTEEFALFKVIIFLIFIYIYMILLFELDDENLTVTRRTLIVIAVIASISLGIDNFNPGFFNLLGNYEVVQGRAASFYRNANYAGASMVILLILSIDMVPKKYRTFFIIIIFFGVLFTMSRSNLMIFSLIIFILFLQKKLYASHLLISVSTIIVFLIWLSTSGFDTLSEKYNIEVTENMKNRINFFADNKHADTSDMNERKEVLQYALEIFTDKPIFGDGFGATILWEHRVGPHNTFAMLWADQGLFGFLLIPLLFFLSTANIFKYGTKEQKQLAVLAMLIFTFSCFFSHDILSAVTFIALMVIVSTIGNKMKRKYYLEDNK